MKRWLLAMTLVLGLPMGLACDDAETAFDCHQVCSRYQSCYDGQYDVSACRDRCRNSAKNDKSVKDKADACESCIGDKSCLSATFSCATDCVGIVP